MEIIQIGNIMKGVSAWDNPSVGRVYDKRGLAPTLNSSAGGGKQPYIVVEDKDDQDIGCDERPIHEWGGGTEQKLEPQFSGCTNTLTSVQKDNLILEISDDQECNDKAGHESWSD